MATLPRGIRFARRIERLPRLVGEKKDAVRSRLYPRRCAAAGFYCDNDERERR